MKIHHIAIIGSDYEISKKFYTEIIGLEIVREVYREERLSYKLDLAIGDHYVIELFSFPNPPARPSRPEACGLRHLAFSVENVTEKRNELIGKGLDCEEIRIDEFTGKEFFFTQDPDQLPIEFYEM
ncbi:VOC family protein [Chryseobacterium sp. BIGb0232]|uniref:SMU1112c/YaeR family gloxylase I-like metalloprotein n=1 Tax=Chryseobacterium sp. BIGb0232 TaxID=2940598 RepID=UPI000F4AA61F|nr:VOC family protein [Chryseobacterium sp. BIGb0232]MCS4301308.1 glyoxylase I family protein [Chryseobacterium sp. BIGb0232]